MAMQYLLLLMSNTERMEWVNEPYARSTKVNGHCMLLERSFCANLWVKILSQNFRWNLMTSVRLIQECNNRHDHCIHFLGIRVRLIEVSL